MGGGRVDFKELSGRSEARAKATQPAEVFTQRVLHQAMATAGMKPRECLASDDHPDPLPVAFVLDTTGSMGHVPANLARRDLLRLLNRMTEMASTGTQTPQICYCGVADTNDRAPFQAGQFESDNRMDDWLTRLLLGGGGGSAYMHEAYPLALYFLARKTQCDIWKAGGKGIAFITGDEMCPATLSREVVEQVFGDTIRHDLKTSDLLKEVQEKWHLFFLYVETSCYRGEEETIFKAWQTLLGDHVVRLDAEATALPEIVSGMIGITRDAFPAAQVPQDLRGLGCDETIVQATAKALRVGADNAPMAEATSSERRARRRGPTKL